MIATVAGRTWDPDLGLAQELARVIDQHLEALEAEWGATPEADEFGVFDRMEHLTGLGFVACQTYMTSTYGPLGFRKADALAKGPAHSGGVTIAAIVNHAANYWKHRDEWRLDRSPRGQERIAAAFDSVGFPVGTDYPLGGILAELTTPSAPQFARILSLLVAWRDELQGGAG